LSVRSAHSHTLQSLIWQKKEGSIGLPLPDVFCRVVDLEDGSIDVPVGQAGELLIRGPQVMAGYFRHPEEEKKVLHNHWLYTGDVVTMDDEGYFYIVDRKKSMIKVSGLQVWPNEIEAVAQFPSTCCGKRGGRGSRCRIRRACDRLDRPQG
jgi:long-chain acyl-CoA synthetase